MKSPKKVVTFNEPNVQRPGTSAFTPGQGELRTEDARTAQEEIDQEMDLLTEGNQDGLQIPSAI